MQIGTFKFSSLFKESLYSPVVTFPSFGSEGHGVQQLRGTPFSIFVRVFNFTYVFFVQSYFPLCFKLSHVNARKTIQESILILLNSKLYASCYASFFLWGVLIWNCILLAKTCKRTNLDWNSLSFFEKNLYKGLNQGL